MKTSDLMDFEFAELLNLLRDAMRHHETMKITGPAIDAEFHGYRAHTAKHLLEVLQPKGCTLLRTSASATIRQVSLEIRTVHIHSIPSSAKTPVLSLTSVSA